MLDIALIGTGGFMPLHNRFLTSMVARLNGSMLLLDCGEGTQVTLRLLGWGFKEIGVICITHFHADHIAGLPGLLLTIGNSDRKEPMIIVGPRGIGEVVKKLCVIAPLPYELQFIELNIRKGQCQEFTAGQFTLSALGLDHRLPCLGYSLDVPRKGKFDVNKAKVLNLPLKFWSQLQKGEEVHYEDKLYRPEMVMGPPRRGLKVSYITDTRPIPDIVDFIRGADIFICEGLYGEEEMLEHVIPKKHMIFSEAAKLALEGEVKELWLTHFSPALTEPAKYLPVAQEIFPNSKVGYDRINTKLAFPEE